MAMILGISSATLIHKLLLKNDGPVQTLKDYIAYYYLRRLKKKSKHRLESLYDIRSCDPWKFGIFIPPEERSFDFPKNEIATETEDTLLIFGVNSRNERLMVKISRLAPALANVWVYLQLSDGRTFVVSDQYCKVPKTGEETFAAGGLRLQCLTPMRRWRVAFNGALRECSTLSADAHYVHVKFNFLWVASSAVVDMSEDIPECVLSRFLASQKWSAWLPDTNSLKECLDSFEQSGMLMGTVSVNSEEEEEMYLWGGRKRAIERVNQVESSLDFFGSLKDGDYFHVCRLILSNTNSSLDYGCIMMPTGFFHVMDDFEINTLHTEEKNGSIFVKNASINFKRDKVPYSMNIDCPVESQKFGNADVYFAPVTLNDDVGHALVIYTKKTEKTAVDDRSGRTLQSLSGADMMSSTQLEDDEQHSGWTRSLSTSKSEFVVKIEEVTCANVDLVGGKGSSLGELCHFLSKNDSNPFAVPKGIVITTKAYERFLALTQFEDEILHLENAAWKNSEDLKTCCERTVASLSRRGLPTEIKLAVESHLRESFGHFFEYAKFAVRSSAVGEDSEDMSAAGQMDTFLGVCGLIQISKAIVKCWSSQFSFTAVQYKRQNGQLLNTPMAVVVQEMVTADTAGVMFTCDPVTGNPLKLTITANYGLGESVVSGRAEPDTICLERNEKGEFKFRSVEIGKKASKIVLSGASGTEERQTTDNESKQCCIEPDTALVLARTALQIENHFACPVDIEWAFQNNQLYLLQVRPVTTIDRPTDFEIKHGVDSAMPSEFEYLSTANVGEVMSGAASACGFTNLSTFVCLSVFKKWTQRNMILMKFNPYVTWKGFIVNQNHLLFSIFDSILRFHKKEGSLFCDSQMISMFGRVIDDEDMIDGAIRRAKKDTSTRISFRMIFYLVYDIMFAERTLQQRSKSVQSEKIDLDGFTNSQLIFYHTMSEIFRLRHYMTTHGQCTFASSIFNLIMLYILRSARGEWHADVYNDFASLVSHCPKVESADVPCGLQALATAIAKDTDPLVFQKMEIQEALTWLQTTTTNPGKMFREFIETHGHRCVNELDLYAKPWNYDATPVILSLKEMVGKVGSEERKAKELSVTQLLNNLKVKLNWRNRLIFRFFLPFCRRAVGQRERSKSVLVKATDVLRQAFRSIEAKMLEEGRLPERDLIYFLTFTEIDDLLRTRSPKIVQSALRRKKMHKELAQLRFPEIMKGIPRTVNATIKEQDVPATLIMKGTPVSLGVVQGIARVATSLEEAAAIRPGEILIAYGTDIGWSPYFPMLSGVATELGGLISHGAVVAREYGLPCVVGLHGATLQFRSGDIVLLDGCRGILKRIDQEHQEQNGNTLLL